MPRELRRLNRMLVCGLLMMAAGLGLSMSHSGLQPDMMYDPVLEKHLFAFTRPAFIVDEGHWNRYTASELLAPLAKLASRDGFRVERHRSKFSLGSLEGIRILVVAGARSMPAGLDTTVRFAGARADQPAFSQAEVDAVSDWVRQRRRTSVRGWRRDVRQAKRSAPGGPRHAPDFSRRARPARV